MTEFEILLQRVKSGDRITQKEIKESMDKLDVWNDSYEDSLLHLVYFAGIIEASKQLKQ